MGRVEVMEEASMRSVRVQMRWMDNPSQDMLLDVHLDRAGLIAGRWSIFGRLKDADRNSKVCEYPFFLDGSGKIMFGPENQGYSTNLREREIRVGELCTIWGDESRGASGGEAWTYRISSVATLGTEKRSIT